MREAASTRRGAAALRSHLMGVACALAAGLMLTPLGFTSAGAASRVGAPTTVQTGSPDVVVDVDSAGHMILPDAAARLRAGGPVVAGGDLTFTYDSPSYPWTAQELSDLQTAVAAIYPVVKQIAGAPAFPHPDNIRKDPASGTGGSYNPSTNEITLGGFHPDALAHEMFHAFRDDWIIYTHSNYEEGMARAGEVEAMSRLPQYNASYWDANHSYYEDQNYEQFKTQWVGAYAGNVFSGFNALLRYELTGYAWGKALIENPSFLANFNATYYAAMGAAGAVSEQDLETIAATVQPAVEGVPFRAWFEQQGALVPRPPIGYFLVTDFTTLGLVQRTPDGWEHSVPNAPLTWTAYDATGAVLTSQSGVTNAYGWTSLNLPNYAGRLRLSGSATAPDGTTVVTNVLDPFNTYGGLHGAVPEPYNTGTVTITDLDDATRSTTAAVTRGVYSAPALAAVRGRFTVTYAAPGGPTFSRQLTKDASDYVVVLASPDLGVTLSHAPDPVAPGQSVAFTATVGNTGPTAAHQVILRFDVPDGIAIGAMDTSAGWCATWTNVPWIDSVLCDLGDLPQGASAVAHVSLTPAAAGTLQVGASVAGSEFDAVTANNIVTQTAAVGLGTTQEDSPTVQFNGWRGVSDPAASGGTYRVSRVAGDTASLTFTGPAVTVVTRKGPAAGKATVRIDGTLRGTYDLYAASALPKATLPFTGLGHGSHTIVLGVTGTHRAASTRADVVIDAFRVGTSTIEDTWARAVYDSWTATNTALADGGAYRSSGVAKSTVTFRFRGSSVDWITAMGPAFGKATIAIDGVVVATIDLYRAGSVQWGVTRTYGGLSAAGVHTLVITVSGQKRAASTGTAVVVDAFRAVPV